MVPSLDAEVPMNPPTLTRQGLARAAALLLAMVLLLAPSYLLAFGHRWWRAGEIVASASFNPGIAPFDVSVRKVPVPVTHSDHFIVELRRGEYVVTAHRFFWHDYTPQQVTIDWPCIEQFTVTFDQRYVATCDWQWGRGATWTLTEPAGAPPAGLSPYFFVPRREVPEGCPQVPTP